MKKAMCLLAVLLLILGMAMPAYAATDDFVPSISYKDGPDIEDATQGDEDVGDCLVVTSIKKAEEKTTDITQEERDLLLQVYEELSEDSQALPMKERYVIRELVSVDYRYTACREAGHPHDAWLQEEGNAISVTFDLGLSELTQLEVFYYQDGEWVRVEILARNDDGTVTCKLENAGPLAFCVPVDEVTPPPATGDTVMLWVWLLLASLAGLALVTMRWKRAW